jgi:hypothetical protein
MTFTGQEFYKNFFCRFQEYVKADRKKYDKAIGDTLWTRYVKGFLSELAKELGFNEERHEDVYKIDSTWKRASDHASVAIEHENDPKAIFEKEVPNLLKTAAPLKVLITYVNDTDFPGEEMTSTLLKTLREEPAFNHEFLLILGTWSMKEPTDWIGSLYRPEVACKTLVLCSNMLEAEKSPGRKAWKTRRETRAGDNEQ